jgi:transposase
MRAYSLDLRTRVVGAVDKQIGTQTEVASLLGVGCTFIKKLLRQRRESGTLAPKSHGGGHVPKLAGPQREVVRSSIVQEQTDAPVEEVQAYVASQLGVEVSQAPVSRGLQSLALPRTKTSGGPRAR